MIKNNPFSTGETAPWPALKKAMQPPAVYRSLKVAVVVGTVLNLINQGDLLFAGAAVSLQKAMLTFCVPFCVSTFAAYGTIRDGEKVTDLRL